MSDAAPQSEGFGRYLAQQRELRGLTLQTVADQTKLSVGMLKALEADDFAHLPERVFIIGAVKAYARAVGLSVEETVLRLQEALAPFDETRPDLSRPKRRPVKLRAGLIGVAVLAAITWFVLHH